jgi:hypothetical protein
MAIGEPIPHSLNIINKKDRIIDEELTLPRFVGVGSWERSANRAHLLTQY